MRSQALMISLYISRTLALTGMWGCKLNETLQEMESMQLLLPKALHTSSSDNDFSSGLKIPLCSTMQANMLGRL